MSRRVLITGVTGYSGCAAVREATALGLDVCAMVHKMDERSGALAVQDAEVVAGDLPDINSKRLHLGAMKNRSILTHPGSPSIQFGDKRLGL